MLSNLRLVYFAHSLRSDWNNGNAHFLRGLLRAMTALGHQATVFEPVCGWSIDNLHTEAAGERSLDTFTRLYPDLHIETYTEDETLWRDRLAASDVVILHEWNPPVLAQQLLALRDDLGFKLLFHDTHHRASSSPNQIALYGLTRFDGILAFGEVLRTLYRTRFGIDRVWTLHEAADTTVFRPLSSQSIENDVVWIGNWGEGERAAELREFLIDPASAMRPQARFKVYGVRYPQEGLQALEHSGIAYGGYLPNLDAPEVYARSRITLHVPRQQYSGVMPGIPTIRVFEALACGIPLISAPWQDTEPLFRPGDFLFAADTDEMTQAIRRLLDEPEEAAAQAARGCETILARHTCDHRARELTAICQELLV